MGRFAAWAGLLLKLLTKPIEYRYTVGNLTTDPNAEPAGSSWPGEGGLRS